MSFRTDQTAMKRAASCTGKSSFTSWSKASRAARRQSSIHGGKFTPYCCPSCHQFHVGENRGDSSHFGGGKDPRQRYIVFGVGPDRKEILIGYSNESTGGQVARRVIETPGWAVSRIIDRKPYLKDAA